MFENVPKMAFRLLPWQRRPAAKGTTRRVDPMKLVSVETPEKSVCKMTFSATAEELEAASNAVYERTRATYTIKGFQKGEADRAQIEADRGEHTFWYDAINDLMDQDVPALYEAAAPRWR